MSTENIVLLINNAVTKIYVTIGGVPIDWVMSGMEVSSGLTWYSHVLQVCLDKALASVHIQNIHLASTDCHLKGYCAAS